jgi:peptidoglycan/LPS O-acetylase OafA/YrhL
LAILTSVLLWPMPEGPIMQVAWTLQHEMLFYLVFTLLIINLRVGMVVFGLWMAACILALPIYESAAFPTDFILKPHNILFVFGIVAGIAYERFSVTQARSSFWVGTVLFMGIGLGETVGGLTLTPALLTLGYGFGAAMAVIGLARGNLPAPRWLVLLGDASYAIYLIHLPAMNILAVGLRASGVHQLLPPLAMLALITALVTGIGVLAHLFIEKPVTGSLGNHRHTKSAA